MLIIPAIDLWQGKVVRLWKGMFEKPTFWADNPLEVAKRWKEEGAQRLHIIDLDGAKTGSSVHLRIVEKVCRLGLNVQFGGGIRNKEVFREAIDAGVSYLILGSGIANREFFEWARENYLDRLIVSIDAREREVYFHGWRRRSGWDIESIGIFLQQKGIKRVIYTDIQRDGTLEGVNISILRRLLENIRVSVIVAGGVGDLKDIREIRKLELPHLEGVIVGRALYENKFTLAQAIEASRG